MLHTRATSFLARVCSASIAPFGSIKFLPIGASLRTCHGADDAAHLSNAYNTEMVYANLGGCISVEFTNHFGFRQADQIDSALCPFHSAGFSQAWWSWPYHCCDC
jgi:hypothetical protein